MRELGGVGGGGVTVFVITNLDYSNSSSDPFSLQANTACVSRMCLAVLFLRYLNMPLELQLANETQCCCEV